MGFCFVGAFDRFLGCGMEEKRYRPAALAMPLVALIERHATNTLCFWRLRLFTDDDLIYAYTTDQAIEDGELIHPYPCRWPWLLITRGIDEACMNAADFDAFSEVKVGRNYEQVLVPLLLDCIMQVRKLMEQHPEGVNFAKLSHTVAGEVWVKPNDKGGMTVMLPSED